MNRIVLIGRIANDLELKKTPHGKSVCSFNLAVKRAFDRNETDFLECVAWNAQAENLVKYQRKGSQLAVEGAVQVDKYQDKEGKNRYKIFVQVNNIEFLDAKKETITEPQTKKIEEIKVEEINMAELEDDLPF